MRRFYFVTPHHAWERGTNENTNGLLQQYLPKRRSMGHLTQVDLSSDRRQAQPSAAQAPRLSHPGGVLCSLTFNVAVQS
jgi:hypothetical protein